MLDISITTENYPSLIMLSYQAITNYKMINFDGHHFLIFKIKSTQKL